MPRCGRILQEVGVVMSVSLLGLCAFSANAQDFKANAGAIAPNQTCDNLLKSERETGGQVLVPNPATPVTLFTVKRPYAGDTASLVYVCSRDGHLVNRIVYMHFQEGDKARAAFARHREALAAELGAACWNPDHLTERQKDLLPGGDLAGMPALAHSVIWNGPSGESVSLHIREPIRASDAWQVRVSSDVTGVTLNEVVRSIYRASGCTTKHLIGD